MPSLPSVMSSVVILDKVDGVGAGVCVLVHLEVVGGKSKRSQDQVPQVLQFACIRDQGFTGGFYCEKYRHKSN